MIYEYVAKCMHCDTVLTDSNNFCNIICEELYREDHQEFHAKMKDGRYEEICPVLEFIDDEELNELVIDNGHWKYRIDKDDVEKWEITPCDCCIEFMDIVKWRDVN